MKLEAILLCDKVFREDNGKIHVQGIFNRIKAQRIPARHPEMYVFFRFYPSAGERKETGSNLLSIEFLHPDGTREKLGQLNAKVAPDGKTEGFVQLQGLVLRQWGQYTFRLSFNDHEVGTTGFECHQIDSKGTKENGPTIH